MSVQTKPRTSNRRDRGHPLLTPHEQLEMTIAMSMIGEAIHESIASGRHWASYTGATFAYMLAFLTVYGMLCTGIVVGMLLLAGAVHTGGAL